MYKSYGAYLMSELTSL